MECSIWIFKWRHLVGKFRTNAGSVIWPKLEPMECLTWIFLSTEFACFVAGEIIQVIEAIPGSVVPLAMFLWKPRKWSKRYVVWGSTPVISFYLSVCYWKWWRHCTWWIEPHWSGLFFLLFFFKSGDFFASRNVWICVLRFINGRAMSGWFMALFLWKTTFS